MSIIYHLVAYCHAPLVVISLVSKDQYLSFITYDYPIQYSILCFICIGHLGIIYVFDTGNKKTMLLVPLYKTSAIHYLFHGTIRRLILAKSSITQLTQEVPIDRKEALSEGLVGKPCRE